MRLDRARQDASYRAAAAEFGAAISRLARGYEADPELRADLVQEIHLALWRSLAAFDGRCALATWVYRVAHNTAASHVARRTKAERLASLEALEQLQDDDDPEAVVDSRRRLERLTALVGALAPADRQVVLLYLEDMDAAAIGEITGLSAGAVAVKIHRLKRLLSRRFQEGDLHGR
ncbi:sigma-70 family RNA polymerase sigma factor [Phenylobacterium sp.]|jgi:RNA polymerase sigma-70 factor (ECF subfamily)|uniref:RNA polymerase sigma factor n=1 Tax=Phenylobacterium sp. TaxID=1871053 RepID=UPI002F93331A